MKKGGWVLTALGSFFFSLSCDAQRKAPEAFTVNCQACHALDQQQVGPSLIEIAGLYPISKQTEFIKWCVDPGKRRPEMAQMPSMVHIPEAELQKIHSYIIGITKNKSNKVYSLEDSYKNSPTAIARPRVVRTFLPQTGPASILFALATTGKHNVVWDTDQCRLRYISAGEIDNFPYLSRNGNDLAKVGEIGYTEDALFAGDFKCQFKGYELNEQGYPTLHYTVGGVKISEALFVKDGVIIRKIIANPRMPTLNKLESSDELQINTKVSGKTLEITYTPS